MAPNTPQELHKFIAAAKEHGASDEALATILENAGWPKSEIWVALGRTLRIPCGVPVPAGKKTKTPAKVAFLYFPALSIRDAGDSLRDAAGTGKIRIERPEMAHLYRAPYCCCGYDRRRSHLPCVLSSRGIEFSFRCQGCGNAAYLGRRLLVLPELST